MAEGSAIQRRFAAEPIFAKTGKGFLISEGVGELERLKVSQSMTVAGCPQFPANMPQIEKSSSKSDQCKPNGESSILANSWGVPRAICGFRAIGNRTSDLLRIGSTTMPLRCSADWAFSV